MMKCPLCDASLDEYSVDSRIQHVNSCLDGVAHNLSSRETRGHDAVTAARTNATRLITCPLCFKENANPSHVKKCGKTFGILPKRLVNLVDTRVHRSKYFKTVSSTNALKAAPKTCKNGDHCKQTLLTSHHNFQSANVKNNENEEQNKNYEERKPSVNKKFVEFLSTAIIQNHGSNSDVLPPLWEISSLNKSEQIFAVDGFEKYCEVSHLINEYKGYLKGSGKDDLIGISGESSSLDNSGELLMKLKLLVNKQTHSDLIIKASDKKIVYSHSFIWKLHSLSGKVVKVTKDLTIIDCCDFKEDIIIEFLNYCYTGVINTNKGTEQLCKLAHELGCKRLVDLLKVKSCVGVKAPSFDEERSDIEMFNDSE